MALLGHAHRSQEQQQEVREARRLLKERVRSDWEYPTLPAYRSTGPRRRKGEAGADEGDEDGGVGARVAGFRFHTPPNEADRNGEGGGLGLGLGLGFEAVEWRERECSTETEAESGSDHESVRSTSSHDSMKSGKTSAYKFDGPDSVGAQISDRRTAKRRKRRRAVEVEMGWNDGLAHWMGRRDVWCCARSAGQVRGIEGGRTMTATATATETAMQHTSAGADSTSSTPRTSTSSTATPSPHLSSAASTPDPAPPPQALSSHPPTPPAPATATATATATAQPPTLLLLLLPIPPPLLPNHPIRRRITAVQHPEIYAKIVQQARTPSVPINLRTLVAALVQGWKADGEWPPKPAAGGLEPSIAGKRRKQPLLQQAGGAGNEGGGFRHGVKAVGRVLRLTGTSEGAAGSQQRHPSANGGPRSERRERVRGEG
ncbi:hypothetical protein LTR36_010596 [Oleoguttula mirabilis]|uniref:Gag1-like clamp domain-containing protein n=1 Tax=Oleoguttula mirabilis TaxID=1507867 RepID=A0AAV9JQH7_9PEZI|nr:hypothetical protein LTR36_010596 [Oleoguttula mirabilis]